MATPDPLVEELLITLAESRAPRIALAARGAVEALPQHDTNTAKGRMQGTLEQLSALFHAAAGPIKMELASIELLPGLAEKLGVSPDIMLLDEGGDQRLVSLVSQDRRNALETYLQTLNRAVEDAQSKVVARDGGER